MAWNNIVERRKFDEEQKLLEAVYRAAGMTEEIIEAMQEFDLIEFNGTRRFCEHTQQFPETVLDESGDDKSPLFEKHFEKLSVSFSIDSTINRYWWIEDLDTPELAKKVKSLPAKDIEFITLLVYEGFTQEEVGKRFGVSQRAVSKRIKQIGKKLNYFSNLVLKKGFSSATT